MKLLKYKKRIASNEKGIVLLFVMFIMISLTSVVMAYLGYIYYSTRSTDAQITDSQAVYLAEAGIHYGIYNLKLDDTWTGTSSAVDLGRGDFSVTVNSLGGGEFRLISTGTVSDQSRTIQQDVNDAIIPKNNTWQETG
jgi:Tfp pilus assembly protein PilX